MAESPRSMSSPELPFHDWACLRTELIWIYDRKTHPDHSDHTPDFGNGHRAWYVRRGEVEIRCSGHRSLRATQGMWLFPPPEKARQLIAADTHLLSLQFLCQWPSGNSLFGESPGLAIKGSQCPALEKGARLLARLAGARLPHPRKGHSLEKAGYDSFLETQSLFLNWLAEWFRVRVRHGSTLNSLMPRDDRVLLAIRCLNEAPLDEPFPTAQLQKQTRLGEAHLNRLFLQALGLGTRKYWQQRKLEFAKSCLESSVMPVKEVAWRLGFKSDSHFVIWFRRLSGRRPGQYRSDSGVQETLRSRMGE